MKLTQDALGMAMTVAPLLLVVLVIIAMLREHDKEKAQDDARKAAQAAKVAAREARAAQATQSVAVDAAGVGPLDAPSNN